MARSFASTKAGYTNLWDKVKILPTKEGLVKSVASKICDGPHKAAYDAVEKATGVPWWFIGALHYREGDLDLETYLGNGQPLGRKTTQVPIDRGPFLNFVEGAIDALSLEAFTKVPIGSWTIPYALYSGEEFNGEGYENVGENDPYVWAGTTLEQPGLFVRDHVRDPTAHDDRLGIAAVIVGVSNLHPEILGEKTVATSAPWPTPATTIDKPILSIPNGPNLILDFEHGLDSVLSAMPYISMFFPQISVISPFIPTLKEALKAAEEISVEGGNMSTILTVVEKHSQALLADIQMAMKKP